MLAEERVDLAIIFYLFELSCFEFSFQFSGMNMSCKDFFLAFLNLPMSLNYLPIRAFYAFSCEKMKKSAR